jgi:hypothetical protein
MEYYKNYYHYCKEGEELYHKAQELQKQAEELKKRAESVAVASAPYEIGKKYKFVLHADLSDKEEEFVGYLGGWLIIDGGTLIPRIKKTRKDGTMGEHFLHFKGFYVCNIEELTEEDEHRLKKLEEEE